MQAKEYKIKEQVPIFMKVIAAMSLCVVDKSIKFVKFTFCSLIHIINKIVLKLRVPSI